MTAIQDKWGNKCLNNTPMVSSDYSFKQGYYLFLTSDYARIDLTRSYRRQFELYADRSSTLSFTFECYFGFVKWILDNYSNYEFLSSFEGNGWVDLTSNANSHDQQIISLFNDYEQYCVDNV